MSDQKHEYPDLLGDSLSNQNFPQSPHEYIRSLPGRNWNDEFQRLIEQTFDDTEAETQRAKQVRKLSKEFAETASQIGTTIISELFVPSSQKTIYPMTSWVGGIAGGEKYVKEGIFFKFALDGKGIYGGDEYMMKSGGHEFKSLMELIDCRVNGLHYPFIVIIDYRGFRLIAESVLPLGPDSIIYGSSDGSKTIRADNVELNKRLEKAAQILNLAQHTVWNWDKTAKLTLHMPVDVEGHIGLDNRFYVIDTARLFPPATPQKGVKGCHLFRLLRPELVKNNPVPLCPDAYSRFLVENREQFDKDIDDATNRLYQKIIPEFAQELNEYYTKNQIFPDVDMTDELTRIVTEAHRKGINLRCFGELRKHVSEDVLHLKELVMTEIVTRVIKNIMRAHMRKLETPQESRYKKLLLTYFNLMFGSTTKSTEFWRLYLKDRINHSFIGGLTKDEMDPNYNLRRTVLTRSLFIRLQKLIGIKFEDSSMDKFKIMEGGLMLLTKDLNEKDLDKIYPIVKYTNRMAFEEGTVLSRKAAKETKGEADEYFKQAQQKYKDALDIKPDDYRALHNWALSLMIQASRKKGQEADLLYDSAIEKLKQALIINKSDARAHLLWGNMLLDRSSKSSDLRHSSQLLAESSEHYLTSYKLDSKQFDLLYNWGNALLYRGKIENDVTLYEQALEKYAMAVDLKKQSVNALRNWAVCMAKYARSLYAKSKSNFLMADKYYEMAGLKFDECLKFKPNDRGVLFNWGNALYRQARMYEFEKNNEMANKLYGLASEKYLTAMNIKANSLDALYNWGKVLQSQACVEGDYATSQDFVFAVTYYFEVFKNVAIKFGEVKLDPIIAMTRLDNKVVQLKAFGFLKWLCNNKINTRLQLEASKAVKSLLESKNNVWLAFSATDSQTELPTLVAQLLQTLGSSDLEEGEGVTLTMDSFHIISELEPGDHKLGQMFKVCREESSELFILRSIESQHLYRRIGIQEDVSPDHVIQYITVADEKNDIKRSYFNHLRGSIPFYASLVYVLRTEDSDYALVYKMKYNPFMLVNYFHPKIAIPDGNVNSNNNTNNNVNNNNTNVNNTNDNMLQIKKKKKISKSISTDNKRKEFDLLFFACEVLVALEDMHNKDMICGDLRPSEIFIDKEGHACLYKLPFTIYSEIKSSDIYPEYTAPEIITGKNHKMETDWYCYGIMLYELFVGKSPFHSSSPHKIFDNVISAIVDWPHDISDTLKDLIQSLIAKDRSKRLKDVEEIKKHAFFRAVNWKTVQERDLEPPFIPQNFESDTFEAVPTLVAQYKKGKFHGFTFVAVD